MEKRKFDLYVHGNIITREYHAAHSHENGACITSHVPFEEVDKTFGIIVEGDMEVDSFYTVNKKVGASGVIKPISQ